MQKSSSPIEFNPGSFWLFSLFKKLWATDNDNVLKPIQKISSDSIFVNTFTYNDFLPLKEKKDLLDNGRYLKKKQEDEISE